MFWAQRNAMTSPFLCLGGGGRLVWTVLWCCDAPEPECFSTKDDHLLGQIVSDNNSARINATWNPPFMSSPTGHPLLCSDECP